MKRACIVAVLFLFIGLVRLQAQDVTIYETLHLAKVLQIPITTPWTSTGVNVAVGDTVNIKCDGIASTNASLSVYWIGPEGSFSGASNVPMPTAPSYSVIGRIGTSGAPFYVGRNVAFRANASGPLYLGYNDGIFSDNFGYYVAFIFKSTR